MSVATPCNPKTWKAEANNPQDRLASYVSQLLHRHKHSHRFRIHIDNHRSDSRHQGEKEGFRTQAHLWSKVRTLPTNTYYSKCTEQCVSLLPGLGMPGPLSHRGHRRYPHIGQLPHGCGCSEETRMTQGPAESGTSSGVSAGEWVHRNYQLLHKSLKAGTGQGQALLS